MINSIIKTSLLSIVLVAGYMYAVNEGYINIKKDDSELIKSIESYESKIEGLQKISGNSKISTEISDLKKKVQDYSSNLNSNVTIKKILSDFSDISKECGVQMLLFEPEQSVASDNLMELPVKIKLRGTFRQTGNFLYLISKTNFSISISDLTIKGIISNSGYVINETDAVISVYNQMRDI